MLSESSYIRVKLSYRMEKLESKVLDMKEVHHCGCRIPKDDTWDLIMKVSCSSRLIGCQLDHSLKSYSCP